MPYPVQFRVGVLSWKGFWKGIPYTLPSLSSGFQGTQSKDILAMQHGGMPEATGMWGVTLRVLRK